MIRCRFQVPNARDPRPVVWPVKHPYWITGYAADMTYAVLVAYADDEAEILRNWPDARNLDSTQTEKYMFNSRFPRPEWLTKECTSGN